MTYPRRFTIRHLRGLGLFALLVSATAALSRWADEKPSDKKPADKGVRVEEEDPTYKPGKPVLRIQEPDVIDKTSRRFPGALPDLKLAAKETKSGYLRKIYQDLDVPHDLVSFNNSNQKERVQPLKFYVGDRPQSLKAGLDLVPLDAEGKPGKAHTAAASTLEKVRHYEQLARDRAAEILANEKELLRPERLIAAEQILTVAMSYFDNVRIPSAESRDQWKTLGEGVRKDLLGVHVAELQEVAELKDWNEAAELARQITKAYKTEAELVRVAVALGELLGKAVNEDPVKTTRLREVRQQVRNIVDQYPANPSIVGLGESLRAQSKELLGRAKKALADSQTARAEELLQQAAELDPQSQELRDLRVKVNESYPILRVHVRELPRFLSPMRATTDSELRAVEMLFESLIKVVPGPDGAARYRPGLAESRPRLVSMGREFRLPSNATWPAEKAGQPEKPVTTTDVSYSVTKLKEGMDGRPRVWGDLLREVDVTDSKKVTLSLSRGHLEPLSLMTFKIVPGDAKVDDDAFAQKPIGSGPYRLGTLHGTDDPVGEYVSFVSNPTYGTRPGRTGLPHIREIRFFSTKDPVKELKEKRIQMALDLSAAQSAEAAKDAGLLAPPPGPNRRIWFLAVNHQPGSVLANADFRKGLALAINREELLDEYFRKGLGKGVHKALNSPYPVGSWAWACNPKSVAGKSSDPFDPKVAEVRIKSGLTAVGKTKVQLPLIYPEGEPALAEALADLRKQVLKVSNETVTLDLLPLKPQEFRKAIDDRRYELAYCHYDFPDETLWLGPLFDPGDKDNYMNYHGPMLQAKIRETMMRRDFEKVLVSTQSIVQDILPNEMPLIPLWQLDPLSAYRAALKPVFYDKSMGPRKEAERVPFDPLLVFTDVENWRLEGQ